MSTIDSELIQLQQQFDQTNKQLSGATTQIMNSIIDSQLTLLKQRIAELEEKKRAESIKEAEKKANPMKVLEMILEEKNTWVDGVTKKIFRENKGLNYIAQMSIEYKKINNYYNSDHMSRFFNEKDNVAMLEPILNILQDIQKRLTALENKNMT
jgi:paraquat-inducible protein B